MFILETNPGAAVWFRVLNISSSYDQFYLIKGQANERPHLKDKDLTDAATLSSNECRGPSSSSFSSSSDFSSLSSSSF